MRRLMLSLLIASLSLPAMAADAIKGNRQEQFGDITVYYNTFNSTVLQPDIARNAELIRSKEQGLSLIHI